VIPKIITSLRISVGVSISILFFDENFATTYGIGYFIMNSWLMVNYTNVQWNTSLKHHGIFHI
jgi:NitT/TauT family transport system permease protein